MPTAVSLPPRVRESSSSYFTVSFLSINPTSLIFLQFSCYFSQVCSISAPNEIVNTGIASRNPYFMYCPQPR